MNQKKLKVLLAKPGLDGHDEGVKIVARALMEAGFDVIYTGLRKTVEEIAERARNEHVNVIGLSILSGSHISICERFQKLRIDFQLTDTIWLVGGTIPAKDKDALMQLGVDAVFPFGTPLQSIIDYLNLTSAEVAG